MQDDLSFFDAYTIFLFNLNEVTKYVRGEGGYLVMTTDFYKCSEAVRKHY